MGRNSNARKKSGNPRRITQITEVSLSADDKNEDTIPLYEAAPKTSEQKAVDSKDAPSTENDPMVTEQISEASEETFSPEDAANLAKQKVIVTEITPSPEDTIDDTIDVPDIVHVVSEQKALVVVSYHLPAVVRRANRTNVIRSTVSSPSSSDRYRRLPFIISTVIVLLFVASGLSYVFLGANAGDSIAPFNNKQPSKATAIVTIVPINRVVKNTYTIAMVTSQPNIAQQQAEGARIISDSQSQSLQVNATGYDITRATDATGVLIFSRATRKVTIPAGTTFQAKNNVALVLDAPVALSRRGFAVAVGGFAYPAGSKGNVPALDIDGTYCFPNCVTGSVYHVQNTAFAGGQDAQSYTYVQQSDINYAASQLENSLSSAAQAAVQVQIQTSEQLAGSMACGRSSLSSSQQAGAEVPYITVSITETCWSEVYRTQPGQTLAANLLKQDLSTLVGPGYSIIGNVTTQVLTQPELIDAHGTLSMKIMASGTVLYQFTNTEAQTFAKLIAGKRVANAQVLLLQQTGVAQASINFANNPTKTLPEDPSKIAFVEVR
jgi:hypothetical protein